MCYLAKDKTSVGVTSPSANIKPAWRYPWCWTSSGVALETCERVHEAQGRTSHLYANFIICLTPLSWIFNTSFFWFILCCKFGFNWNQNEIFSVLRSQGSYMAFFAGGHGEKPLSALSLPPSYLLTVAAVGNSSADLTRRTNRHTHRHTHTYPPSKNTTQSLHCCLQGAMPESCHLEAEVGPHAIQDSLLCPKVSHRSHTRPV